MIKNTFYYVSDELGHTSTEVDLPLEMFSLSNTDLPNSECAKLRVPRFVGPSRTLLSRLGFCQAWDL